jgi:hypothetical protein
MTPTKHCLENGGRERGTGNIMEGVNLLEEHHMRVWNYQDEVISSHAKNHLISSTDIQEKYFNTKIRRKHPQVDKACLFTHTHTHTHNTQTQYTQ